MDLNTLFARPGAHVAVTGLDKTFHGGGSPHRALAEVTCSFAPGTITMIQSPSGGGKSTLLNLIGGVDTADAGRMEVDGVSIDTLRTQAALAAYRLRMVGFVFQSYNLIPGLTARENLELPMTVAGLSRRAAGGRAEALLALVDMAGKQNRLPEELSGGEQQRVAIALALVNDPPLILADEPTGNLDSNNARHIVDLLVSLAQLRGKTVLVATHDPLVATRGQYLLSMRDGRIQDSAVGASGQP